MLLAEGAQVCAVAAPWRKWWGFGPAKRSNTWQYYMKKILSKIWIEMWHPLGLKVSLMFDQHSWILPARLVPQKCSSLAGMPTFVGSWLLAQGNFENSGSFHEKRIVCLTRVFPVFTISIVPHTFPASTHHFWHPELPVHIYINVGYRLVWGYRIVSTDSKIILYLWKMIEGYSFVSTGFWCKFFHFFVF